VRLGPSSFPRDPYGHLTNQAAHFCLGLGLSAVLWPLWGIPSALVIGALYGFLWEGLVQKWVLPWASFEDSLHVTTGGAAIVSALSYDWPGLMVMLAVWAGLLAVGVWRRRS